MTDIVEVDNLGGWIEAMKKRVANLERYRGGGKIPVHWLVES